MSIAPPPSLGGEPDKSQAQSRIAPPPAASVPRIAAPPAVGARAAAPQRISPPPSRVAPQKPANASFAHLADAPAVEIGREVGGEPAAHHVSSALDKVGQFFETWPGLVGAAGQDIGDKSEGLLGFNHVRDYVNRVFHGDMNGAVEKYKTFGEANLRTMAAQGDVLAKWMVGNAPAGRVQHPFAAAAGDALENIVSPYNALPDGLGAAGRAVRGSKVGRMTADAVHDTAEAVKSSQMAQHIRAQRMAQRAAQIHNEIFGKATRPIDRAVAPGQEAAAHAARRAYLQANEAGNAVGHRLTRLIMGTQKADADVMPALYAHQRSTKEAWLAQQAHAHPEIYKAADDFVKSYHAARAANEPGLPPGNYERALGKPSVYDVLDYADSHHFVQRELAHLDHEQQQHALKIAREIELAQEGPALHDLTPAQAAIAHRMRGVMGYITAHTQQKAPGLLEGEQIGYVPARDIYAYDHSPEGGTRGYGVREKIDATKIPSAWRRQKLWEYSQNLPDEDRLLHAAPYSAKTPEQAIQDFISTRFANLYARQAQPMYEHVRSATGEPMIYEPPMGMMTDPQTGAQVIPKDKASLERLVTGAQERAALEKTANVVGMKPAETDAYLASRPQAGVAAGRARQAKSAANQAARVAGSGAQTLGKTEEGLRDLQPAIAKEQLAQEQGVREAFTGRPVRSPGEPLGKPTETEKIAGKMHKSLDEIRSGTKARALAIMDRFSAVNKAAGAAKETIAARPGSRELAGQAREYAKDTKATLDEIAQRLQTQHQIDPKQRTHDIRALADAVISDATEQDRPLWEALSEMGGRVIPDYVWKRDPKTQKFGWSRAGEWQDARSPYLGKPKAGFEQQQGEGEGRLGGNFDKFVQLVQQHGWPSATEDEVREALLNLRRPTKREAIEEARKQYDDMTGVDARKLQGELREAAQYNAQAQKAYKDELAAGRAITPEEKAVTNAARTSADKTQRFGKSLATQLARNVEKTGNAAERARTQLGDLQAAHRKIGGRVYDVVDNANIRQSRTLQRGVANAHERLQRFGKTLDTYAKKASDESKVREIARQYARLTQTQKAHLQALYKRVLRDTPRAQFYPKATYDKNLYVPAKDVRVHGQPYPFLDAESKVVHKALVEQLEYDHAPYAEANAAAEALSTLNQAGRMGMVTNAAIHPVFNQGMMYAFETGDWAGLAHHAVTVLTGLDPIKAVKFLEDGHPLTNAVPNGLLGLAQKTNAHVWAAVRNMQLDYADELADIAEHHGFHETAPLEMDTRDFKQPVYDKSGKLVDYVRHHDKEMDPAHIETTRADELPLTGKTSKMYRAFAKWNHDIVWQTSEPLLMARYVRYFKRKGMSAAEAVDAARERLGTDKLTHLWKSSGLLFPRWTRTVIASALRLGVMKPQTWNVPLQATKTEREGVGAGDLPTGINPMTIALPAGDDANGTPQYNMIGMHDPMASPLNTAAGAVAGDPRYTGLASHGITPMEFVENRMAPSIQMPLDAGATIASSYANRTIPGSYLRAADLKNLTPQQILARFLYGMASRPIAPLQSATDAIENPFSIPIGLTGSTDYLRSDNYSYPEEP